MAKDYCPWSGRLIIKKVFEATGLFFVFSRSSPQPPSFRFWLPVSGRVRFFWAVPGFEPGTFGR